MIKFDLKIEPKLFNGDFIAQITNAEYYTSSKNFHCFAVTFKLIEFDIKFTDRLFFAVSEYSFHEKKNVISAGRIYIVLKTLEKLGFDFIEIENKEQLFDFIENEQNINDIVNFLTNLIVKISITSTVNNYYVNYNVKKIELADYNSAQPF